MYTRRDTAKFVLLAATLPVLPAVAGPDWKASLWHALSDRLVLAPDTTLTVGDVRLMRQGGQVTMATAIRLDWPPGHRLRHLQASGRGDEDAFSNLLDASLAHITKAWPGTLA